MVRDKAYWNKQMKKTLKEDKPKQNWELRKNKGETKTEILLHICNLEDFETEEKEIRDYHQLNIKTIRGHLNDLKSKGCLKQYIKSYPHKWYIDKDLQSFKNIVNYVFDNNALNFFKSKYYTSYSLVFISEIIERVFALEREKHITDPKCYLRGDLDNTESLPYIISVLPSFLKIISNADSRSYLLNLYEYMKKSGVIESKYIFIKMVISSCALIDSCLNYDRFAEYNKDPNLWNRENKVPITAVDYTKEYFPDLISSAVMHSFMFKGLDLKEKTKLWNIVIKNQHGIEFKHKKRMRGELN